MYFRRKQTEDREYLQIVANTRVDGKPQQKVLATLGRVDEFQASGQMDRFSRDLQMGETPICSY